MLGHGSSARGSPRATTAPARMTRCRKPSLAPRSRLANGATPRPSSIAPAAGGAGCAGRTQTGGTSPLGGTAAKPGSRCGRRMKFRPRHRWVRLHLLRQRLRQCPPTPLVLSALSQLFSASARLLAPRQEVCFHWGLGRRAGPRTTPLTGYRNALAASSAAAGRRICPTPRAAVLVQGGTHRSAASACNCQDNASTAAASSRGGGTRAARPAVSNAQRHLPLGV